MPAVIDGDSTPMSNAKQMLVAAFSFRHTQVKEAAEKKRQRYDAFLSKACLGVGAPIMKLKPAGRPYSAETQRSLPSPQERSEVLQSQNLVLSRDISCPTAWQPHRSRSLRCRCSRPWMPTNAPSLLMLSRPLNPESLDTPSLWHVG